MTPYELWFQRKPRIKDLRIFGEKVFTHVPKEKRHKLDAKARKGFFIGYDDKTKGVIPRKQYNFDGARHRIHGADQVAARKDKNLRTTDRCDGRRE